MTIADLIDTWAPRLQRAFLDAIGKVRDGAQVGLIAKMLEQGDVDGAIRAVGLDPVAFRGLDLAIGQAYEAGGNAAADGMPAGVTATGHRLRILFNVRNPGAESWLRQHSATLVTQIVDDQRAAIRQHLTAGMEAGNNPKTVALDLVGRIGAGGTRTGGVVGLTASQEGWGRAYAAELASGDPAALTRVLRDKRFDKTVQKAIDAGKPLPTDLQAKMIATYRNRALRYRAETIGRTEAMTSLHQSQDEAYRQAIAKGQVSPSAVRKVWHSAGDARVRETHRTLNGESVGLNQLFSSPSGAHLAFPGDPTAPAAEVINCRCWCQYRVDHLANMR